MKQTRTIMPTKVVYPLMLALEVKKEIVHFLSFAVETTKPKYAQPRLICALLPLQRCALLQTQDILEPWVEMCVWCSMCNALAWGQWIHEVN